MRNTKKILIWSAIIVIAAGTLYYFFRPQEEVLETETVIRGSLAETVSVTGELVPLRYADLSFATVGRVRSVLAEEGAQVKAGQLLATLDTAVLDSQLKESRIKLTIAEENEKLARRGWDALSPEERKAKKLATEQARENVQTALAQKVNSRIHVPFAGFLSQMDIRVGETVTAGTVIARVAESDQFIIESRVPESDIAKIKEGMTAVVTFDALRQDEEFAAKVSEISQSSNVVDNVVSYTVKFQLESVDPRIKDGMTANLDIETEKRENVLILPYRALIKEGDQMFAEVVGADGGTEKREVVIGLEGDEGLVEIKSGLSEGEKATIGARQTR
ncbi:MAG: hypothetical protein A2808_00960 [Candidatus Moranbacteria bacterium RIFCSPHIGHO2_01_FULL_55_24]|nr:MAG: hypothetical protein A2808_00960 [Candidatus Moranbacteria bacterium RIFCSPHIGHO2_01_FULL_55_24]